MKPGGSERSRALLVLFLLPIALAMIGVGLGAWLHWGIGLAAAGVLLWIDLQLMSSGK